MNPRGSIGVIGLSRDDFGHGVVDYGYHLHNLISAHGTIQFVGGPQYVVGSDV